MLQYLTYSLPFNKPFVTQDKEFTHREGIILVYKEGNIIAYGEAAPLPGFSEESLNDVRTVLTTNHKHLEKEIRSGDGKDTLRLLTQIHRFPSLSFALDTLLHDLDAKRAGKTLSRQLFNNEKGTIACNYTLSIMDKELALLSAKSAYELGFSTIKVKTGSDFEQEYSIIQEIRDRYPDIKIRIDANSSWSVKEAKENLNALKSENIEYCEQPIAKGNLEGMAEIRNSVNIPIAADEDVRSKNDAIRIIGEKAADILIIKPMLFGTFRDINVTKQLADTHNIELVFTTSLESVVGTTTTAILAHGLGSKKYAHGLATGLLFEHDITSTDFLKQGKFHLNDKTGTGVPIDIKSLDKM
ncbi:MAG: o-succinylbenzoate synthase [Balneolaceae bacterium]|nr:o-succinylbenzoate synthase [Balneolaceae bacterium]